MVILSLVGLGWFMFSFKLLVFRAKYPIWVEYFGLFFGEMAIFAW